MNLVVDANVLFACLLREGTTNATLLNPALQLTTPEFILQEIASHERELLALTQRPAAEFRSIAQAFEQIVTIIPKEDFAEMLPEAERICPDPDDVMYLALALKLQCPIWSNDKALKEQSAVKILSTAEVLVLLSP